MILFLFWALTFVGCVFASTFGGKDGRWAALLILSASMLSVPAIVLGQQWHHTETGLLAVDVLLLSGLYGLTLTSTRCFPIWMTGFQLVAVATHLARLIAPDITPRIYQAVEQLWAIPMTLVMMLGIWLDIRTGPGEAQAVPR